MTCDEKALQEVRESRLLIDRVDDWLFDEFRAYVGQRVLEIGCGLGNHFEHLLDRESLVGIDVSQESIAQVRMRFSTRSNVRVMTMDITAEAALALASYECDTALSVNVFEHIKDDQVALQHTYDVLQPGGRLILVVPAHSWLYGPMDSSIGHFRRYTRDMLGERLQRAGFRVMKLKYVNALGALGWLVNGRLLRRRVPPRGQLKLLNLMVPWLQALERYVRTPIGVSLLAISEK